jgi:hypothetical protein
LPGGGGGGGDAAGGNQKQLGGAGAVGKVAITYSLQAPTYAWIATSGSADWTVAANWSPSRTTPAIGDILVFTNGGNSTATNVPAQTIGKLQVSLNTAVTLQPTNGANTLTIAETAADALTVAAGSQLNIGGDVGLTNLTITVATGAKGSISGSMAFSDNLASPSSFTLTAADVSGITFNSGATFAQICGGNVFGSGTTNSVVFASGSSFIQQFGSNPFQKSQPASVVVFQAGSLFSFRQIAIPSVSGRTYADFEYNVNGLATASGANPLTISNLSVVQGTFNISMNGGFNLNGNASVAAGATLNLNNSVNTASGKTLTINGTLGGTGTNTGNATFVISSTGTLAPGISGSSIGTLTFATPPTLNGTNYMKLDRNGGTPLADKVALTGGTLAFGGTLVVTNIGADLQAGDIFTLFSASSYSGSFSAPNLPPLNPGLSWANTLATDGKLSVVSSATSISYIAMTSFSLSGTNILIGGTNQGAGTYYVLASTNVALPKTNWTAIATNTLGASGNFTQTATNAVIPGIPQKFFILSTTNNL